MRCLLSPTSPRLRARLVAVACVLAAALALLPPNGAAAASIGMDFGSEKITVALARSSARDVTVVPNRLGYRSSPTLIGFAVWASESSVVASSSVNALLPSRAYCTVLSDLSCHHDE